MAGPIQPKRWYTVGGLLLLGVLLLTVNAVADRLLSGMRIDLTSNSLYTLADGTKEVLADIDEPLNLYYFYSEEAASAIPQINSHARRVRELLEEFSAVAGDKLRLTIIDPEPFSDAEDRAVELGIEPLPLDNSNSLYFGLAGTNAVGERQVISYFQLNRATLLEYDLSKLVYQLAHPKKPVVGLMTDLPLAGGYLQQTRQPMPPWFIHQRVGELFDLQNVAADGKPIPADVDVLLLVHPSGLSDAALYAIDQYLLKGGKLVALIDPFAEMANPGARSSSLDKLLQVWGIEYDASQVVGDPAQAIAIAAERNQPPIYHLALLGVAGENINSDDVITRGLSSVNLGFSGSFAAREDAALEFTPLLKSSARAAPIAASRMENLRDPSSLQTDFEPGQQPLVLAARVSGKLKSAFPDGPPEGVESDAEHVSEAAQAANMVLIGDVDLMTDRFWVQFQNLLGQRLPIPFANNADFVINALDNLLGSNALINIRSRADYVRPFDKVLQLRREADAKFRIKEQELQAKLRETESKLREFQTVGEGDNRQLILSEEQQQALLNYQEEKLRIRKQLRDVRHQLDKDIEALGTTLKFVNILLVPLLLSLIVVTIAATRGSAGTKIQTKP
ncbi:MAG: Gldg family protein [Gammaproteobacteria bacterium]|nr:Gldg family protein [Gammaproteobacteria bacterium]